MISVPANQLRFSMHAQEHTQYVSPCGITEFAEPGRVVGEQRRSSDPPPEAEQRPGVFGKASQNNVDDRAVVASLSRDRVRGIQSPLRPPFTLKPQRTRCQK